MYNFIKRLLSFLLFIVLLCYNLLNSTINVFAIVDYSSQATEIGLEEAKYECAEEAMLNLTQESDIDISKDNFYKLHNRDGLPYNYIHILVQHHIRCYNSILKDNELYIQYSKDKNLLRDICNNQWIPILNTLTKPYLESKALNQVLKSLKKFDSYAGKSGSIDLWSITDDGEDIFVWEVKPGSFEKYPKRIKGIEQIYRYVNLPKIKVGTNLAKNDVEFYFGNDIMLECPTGNFEFSIENSYSEIVLYSVSYNTYDDGLVIYHFDRYAKKKPEPECCGIIEW